MIFLSNSQPSLSNQQNLKRECLSIGGPARMSQENRHAFLVHERCALILRRRTVRKGGEPNMRKGRKTRGIRVICVCGQSRLRGQE